MKILLKEKCLVKKYDKYYNYTYVMNLYDVREM